MLVHGDDWHVLDVSLIATLYCPKKGDQCRLTKCCKLGMWNVLLPTSGNLGDNKSGLLTKSLCIELVLWAMRTLGFG